MTDSILAVTDLPPDLQSNPNVTMMVDGANGQAQRVAPCLFVDPDPGPVPTAGQLSEARLCMLGAIIRWAQQGAQGSNVQQTAGPFSLGVSNSSPGYRLWPSEITQLQEICSGASAPTVGSIDTAPGLDLGHLPWCDIMFGSDSCSCGYSIAQRPIYENAPGL